jgi:hypothetical protein
MDPAIRRYSRAPGVLSFVGFAPADDPRIAMLVMLDEPKNEKWGSEAAAPIFAAIGREALQHLHVPPRDSAPVQLVRGDTAAPADPPALPGDGAGRGATSPVSLIDEAPRGPSMPSLRGLSLRQAMSALAALDVEVEIEGRGMVVAQFPPAGSLLDEGTVCRLTLASPAGTATVARR